MRVRVAFTADVAVVNLYDAVVTMLVKAGFENIDIEDLTRED